MADITVYLAGFDLFKPDAASVFASLCSEAVRFQLIPLAPIDGDLPPAAKGVQLARHIFTSNVAKLSEADGVIANLAPFRGHEPDSGTVFEVGFAIARGIPLSSRQTAVIFGLRRFDQVAEWLRLYADHGVAALQPGWKGLRARMNKIPIQRDDAEAFGDDQRNREELMREVQQVRMENAYLKKAHALVQAKTRSAPKKGR